MAFVGLAGPRRARGVARRLFAVLAVLTLGACSADAGLDAEPPQPDRNLQGGDPLFLVQFGAEADLIEAAAQPDWLARGRAVTARLQQTAARSQAPAQALLDDAGVRYYTLWISNTMAVFGDAALGSTLAELPGVQRVWQEEVPPLETLVIEPRPGASDLPQRGWQKAAINLPVVAGAGFDGSGVTVGFVDTGVAADHPELSGNYRGGQVPTPAHDFNWFSPLADSATRPSDLGEHGTAVASLAVGARTGVAPGATWIAALGCTRGGCPMSGVLAAQQFMLAPSLRSGAEPDPDRRPQVVNNSWVRATYDLPLRRASRALAAAGIFQTFAVGNGGPACGTAQPLGDSPDLLSVGATTSEGEVALYSARGPAEGGVPAPDLVAPGEWLWAARSTGGHQFASGTSFAAPQVAGVAALMLQANPALVGQPEQLALLLTESASAVPSSECGASGRPNLSAGWGSLDAASAVLAACRVRGSRTLGACIRDQ